MPFRFPNRWDAIGDALQDALNPETSEDGTRVLNLLEENNRAVEDAFTPQLSGGITSTDDAVTNNTYETGTWTLPSNGTYLHWSFTVYGDFPADAEVWLLVREDGTTGGFPVGPGKPDGLGFGADYNAGCSVSGWASAGTVLEFLYGYTSATAGSVTFGLIGVASIATP